MTKNLLTMMPTTQHRLALDLYGVRPRVKFSFVPPSMPKFREINADKKLLIKMINADMPISINY